MRWLLAHPPVILPQDSLRARWVFLVPYLLKAFAILLLPKSKHPVLV
jgi:hypothetical protein